MTKLRDNNYINIQSFMVKDLNLKGNELLIYAIIYGFSQTDDTSFTGGLQYLADWTNSTKQGVIKNLKSLADKGYIAKSEKYINGIKFCEYRSTLFNEVVNNVEQGALNNVEQGVKQSLPNKITDNKSLDTQYKPYRNLIVSFTDNEELIKTIYAFLDMRKSIKKPMGERALTLLLNKLKRLATDVKTQIDILNQSILHSWQDVYPLKADYNERGANGVLLDGRKDDDLDGIF